MREQTLQTPGVWPLEGVKKSVFLDLTLTRNQTIHDKHFSDQMCTPKKNNQQGKGSFYQFTI